jgi:hypothetical protein
MRPRTIRRRSVDPALLEYGAKKAPRFTSAGACPRRSKEAHPALPERSAFLLSVREIKRGNPRARGLGQVAGGKSRRASALDTESIRECKRDRLAVALAGNRRVRSLSNPLFSHELSEN